MPSFWGCRCCNRKYDVLMYDTDKTRLWRKFTGHGGRNLNDGFDSTVRIAFGDSGYLVTSGLGFSTGGLANGAITHQELLASYSDSGSHDWVCTRKSLDSADKWWGASTDSAGHQKLYLMEPSGKILVTPSSGLTLGAVTSSVNGSHLTNTDELGVYSSSAGYPGWIDFSGSVTLSSSSTSATSAAAPQFYNVAGAHYYCDAGSGNTYRVRSAGISSWSVSDWSGVATPLSFPQKMQFARTADTLNWFTIWNNLVTTTGGTRSPTYLVELDSSGASSDDIPAINQWQDIFGTFTSGGDDYCYSPKEYWINDGFLYALLPDVSDRSFYRRVVKIDLSDGSVVWTLEPKEDFQEFLSLAVDAGGNCLIAVSASDESVTT